MGPVYTFNFLPRGLFLGISGGGVSHPALQSEPYFRPIPIRQMSASTHPPLPGIFSVKNEHYQLLT